MYQYLDTGSSPIHWNDYGGNGPLMVMVHGLGGSTINWDIIGPRLSDRYRVVALDLPGFGLSPPARDYTLHTHVEAIRVFVEHFSQPAIVVGNSLGGLLSEMFAAEYPELVDSLLLIAPATPPRFPDPNVNWPMATRLAISSLPGVGVAINRHIVNSRTSEQLINESLNRITHRPSRIPLDMIASFVRLAELRRSMPWGALAIPKTGQSIRSYFTKPSRFVAMIRRIKAPTLVVQGLADPIVSPTSIEWMCSLRSDWTLIQMEDTGHTPQIDAPIRLLRVLDPWLDERQIHLLSV